MKPLFLFIACFLLLPQYNLYAIENLENIPDRLPNMGFTKNIGQVRQSDGKKADEVLFYYHGNKVSAFLTSKGLVISYWSAEDEYSKKKKRPGTAEKTEVKFCRVNIYPEGGKVKSENIQLSDSFSYAPVFYYLGDAKEKIVIGVHYKTILIKDVYPGIDWRLHVTNPGTGVKHEFIIHPGADASLINMLYEGSGKFSLFNTDRIYIETPLGTLDEGNLFCYFDHSHQPIRSHYEVSNKPSIMMKGFSFSVKPVLETNISTQQIVIDPEIKWGTFYGANGTQNDNLDSFIDVATDNSGNIYVTGYSVSPFFPVFNNGSYFDGQVNGPVDAIIVKFNSSGHLLWSSCYGGNFQEIARAIAIDPQTKKIFIVGETNSADFPVYAGSGYFDGTPSNGNLNGFVVIFDSLGNRQHATFIGSNGYEIIEELYFPGNGHVYLVGYGGSGIDIPVLNSGGFFQLPYMNQEIFILDLDSTFTITWGTYLGGNSDDVALGIAGDSAGNIYIAGSTGSNDIPFVSAGGFFDNTPVMMDGYIAKFSPSHNLLWSSSIGGTNNESGFNLTILPNQDVVFSGISRSSDFPVVNSGGFTAGYNGGPYDGFIARFNSNTDLIWSTYIGGTGFDIANGSYLAMGLLPEYGSSFWVGGMAAGSGFPTVDPGCNSFYQGVNAGSTDCCLLKFDSLNNLVYSTYFGGAGDDFVLSMTHSGTRELIVVGEWLSTTSNALSDPGGAAYFQSNGSLAGEDDSFILKIDKTFGPHISIQTTPSCRCDGTATANFLCSTGPLNYTWSTGSTSGSISGLCPGIYWLAGYDQAGNYDSLSFIIPPSFSIIPSSTIDYCSNGTSTAYISGGNSPFTYSWSTNPVQTTATATGLVGGNYSLIVTDSLGCYDTLPVNITSDPFLVNWNGDTSLLCSGDSTAFINLTASGGITPYVYSWSGGQSTSGVTGLGAGNYTVGVVEQSGCVITNVFTITNPLSIQTFFNLQPVSCAVCCDGQGTVTVGSGGTPPFTYLWQPWGFTTASVSGLCPGNYTVCVTDSNGCESCTPVQVQITGITEDFQIHSGIQINAIIPGQCYQFSSVNPAVEIELLKMYSLSGQSLGLSGTRSKRGPSITLDLTSYPPGIYFAEFNTGHSVIRIKTLRY